MAFIKPKLYLEPSVSGYYFDRDEPEKWAVTRRFFEVEVPSGRYDVVSAESALRALENGSGLISVSGDELVKFAKSLPLIYLPVTDAIGELAEKFVADGLIAAKDQEDALHLAFAVVHHASYIVSWDFKHMVKPKTKKAVKIMSLKTGVKEVRIITPEAVVISADVV